MPLAPPLSLPIARTWDGAPAFPDERVMVLLRANGDGLLLDVDAPLHGDPAPAAPPGPTWALWEHEVVELFLLGAEARYLEIELGPRGHYLALQLEGARNAVACCLALDVRIMESGPHRWRLRAHIPGDLLPPGPYRANAYAIHGLGAARRYLAWTPVPGPRPDFHRLSCFQTVDIPGARIATRPD